MIFFEYSNYTSHSTMTYIIINQEYSSDTFFKCGSLGIRNGRFIAFNQNIYYVQLRMWECGNYISVHSWSLPSSIVIKCNEISVESPKDRDSSRVSTCVIGMDYEWAIVSWISVKSCNWEIAHKNDPMVSWSTYTTENGTAYNAWNADDSRSWVKLFEILSHTR